MLANKTILITGASGGLGRALSIAFCQHGAKVIGFARSAEKLQETQSLIEGDLFSFHVVDVSSYSEVEQAISAVISEQGQIDLVFNNAAIYVKENFLDESPASFQSSFDINVIGVANVCKAVLPSMITAGKGNIFNLGSWAHLGPIADSAAYSASKGAVHSLSKAIAIDVATRSENVFVHEWIPGHLNTQMSDFTGIDPAIAANWGVENAIQALNGSSSGIYEQNRKWLPPKGLKQKILSKIGLK